MEKIVPTVEQHDYDNYREFAHSLKGASGYVGASRLHYACFFIQEHHYHKRYQEMLEYYPLLVEAAIEFRVFSRQINAENNGKFR